MTEEQSASSRTRAGSSSSNFLARQRDKDLTPPVSDRKKRSKGITWEESYSMVAQIKKKYGLHCVKAKGGEKLHKWLNNQRSFWARGTLPSEKAVLLGALGVEKATRRGTLGKNSPKTRRNTSSCSRSSYKKTRHATRKSSYSTKNGQSGGTLRRSKRVRERGQEDNGDDAEHDEGCVKFHQQSGKHPAYPDRAASVQEGEHSQVQNDSHLAEPSKFSGNGETRKHMLVGKLRWKGKHMGQGANGKHGTSRTERYKRRNIKKGDFTPLAENDSAEPPDGPEDPGQHLHHDEHKNERTTRRRRSATKRQREDASELAQNGTIKVPQQTPRSSSPATRRNTRVPWLHRMQALNKYKESNGDLRIHFQWTGGGIGEHNLGHWVINTRQKFKNSKLTDNQVKQLDDMGFLWDARQKQAKRPSKPFIATPAKKKRRKHTKSTFASETEPKDAHVSSNCPTKNPKGADENGGNGFGDTVQEVVAVKTAAVGTSNGHSVKKKRKPLAQLSEAANGHLLVRRSRRKAAIVAKKKLLGNGIGQRPAGKRVATNNTSNEGTDPVEQAKVPNNGTQKAKDTSNGYFQDGNHRHETNTRRRWSVASSKLKREHFKESKKNSVLPHVKMERKAKGTQNHKEERKGGKQEEKVKPFNVFEGMELLRAAAMIPVKSAKTDK